MTMRQRIVLVLVGLFAIAPLGVVATTAVDVAASPVTATAEAHYPVYATTTYIGWRCPLGVCGWYDIAQSNDRDPRRCYVEYWRHGHRRGMLKFSIHIDQVFETYRGSICYSA